MKRRKRMEFSQKIIAFASVIYALTWCAAVYSWFSEGTSPERLLEFVTALYAAALAVYGGKSAYENRAKISARYGEKFYEGGDGD